MGRFEKGCKPGPGRPKANKELSYSEVFRKALTPEAAFAIVERAVTQASNGDHRAREWIFKHVLQPQPQRIDVGRFQSNQEIETEADHRTRFFEMALRAARTVEQAEFLLGVARKLAESQEGANDG